MNQSPNCLEVAEAKGFIRPAGAAALWGATALHVSGGFLSLSYPAPRAPARTF